MSSSDSEAPTHEIRQMRSEDVEGALQVWKAIGLHEGTATIASFQKVDPEGFHVCIQSDTGRVIGTCAAVFTKPDSAFVGLYAILPEYQGRGLGIRLWRACMQHVGSRNVGLCAVPKQLATYRDKAGFRIKDNKRMVVYEGRAPLDLSDLVQSLGNVNIELIDQSNQQLVDKVITYDSKVVRFLRADLLKEITQEPDSIALVAVDKFNQNVVGYGCIRTNSNGQAMAGPVYADNDAVAELLLTTAVKQFKPAQELGLVFMPLDSCPGAIRLAEKMKLVKDGSFPRLFTKFIPEADFGRIYCLTTPNFSPF